MSDKSMILTLIQIILNWDQFVKFIDYRTTENLNK